MASKKYARISDYGDLLVPLSLLDKIVSECCIVSTSYDGGNKQVISEIKPISRVEIHDEEELKDAEVQQKLSGDA